MKVRASGSCSLSFEIRSGVRQGCALSPTRFNSIIDLILSQALQGYPGIQVGMNVHVYDLAYADDVVLLSNSYREMQGLLQAVTGYFATVGVCINASKTNVMPALIPCEQRQAVLLVGEPLEDVEKYKYLGYAFIANGQGTEEIRSSINLARPTFSRLQSCIWSRHETSLRTKFRVYQAVVWLILLYGCETWVRSILHVRRRDCVPTAELRCHLRPAYTPAQLFQRRFR